MSHFKHILISAAYLVTSSFTFTPTPNMEHYPIPASSFANFLWIKNGALFTNVNYIEIEMTNEGAFRLEVLDSNDKLISKGSRDNPHGGWHTFKFTSLVPPVRNGSYKLKLVNEAPGTRQVHGGNVHF